jgi:hypothetical protein
LVVDSVNLFAVEIAAPYHHHHHHHHHGHGRIYYALDESLDVLRMSLAFLVTIVLGSASPSLSSATWSAWNQRPSPG